MAAVFESDLKTTISLQRQYSYQPLVSPRHIRIIILHQGSSSSPLQCSIEQLNLDNPDGSNHVYEALSYTWGVATPTHTLLCNNHPLSIASNLHSALLHIRYEEKPRTLWIDAVCINQNDVSERNAQVCLMSKIYYEAGRVVIWLGESDSTTLDGIKMLEDLERRVQNAISKASKRFDFEEPDFQFDDTWDPRSARSLPLRNILQRPWFSRIWVLQECSISRATIAYCGRHIIPWSTLEHACSYLGVAPRHEQYLDTTMVQTMRMATGSSDKGLRSRHRAKFLRLLRLLLLTNQHCDATDPRDKVYALLGIAAEGLHAELAPDYARSVRDVYTATARLIINSSGSMNLLSLVEDRKILNDQPLPSWVPDWRRRGDTRSRIPLCYHASEDRLYKAAGNSPLIKNISSVFSSDPSVLIATGMYLSSISKTWSVPSATSLFETRPWRWCDDLSYEITCPEFNDSDQDQDMAKTQTQPYAFASSRSESVARAYGITLMADLWYFSSRISESFRRLYFADLHSKIQRVPENQSKEHIEEIKGSIDSLYVQHIDMMLIGRKVFRTHDGMIGLCPQAAAEGDCVIILPGADMPMVLRRLDCNEEGNGVTNKDTEEWKFIGESYVHGMMDGEALEWLGDTRFLQEYQIR